MKKMLFSLFLVSSFLLLETNVVVAATPDDLVGWWKLNGNTNDSSNYENDGESQGADAISDGYTFVESDYISVEHNDSLNIVGAITIEAKIKPLNLTTTNGDYRAIVTKRDGNYSNYALRINGKKIEFYYNGPSANNSATDWNVWQGTSKQLESDQEQNISVVFVYGSGAISVKIGGEDVSGSWIAGSGLDTVNPNSYELRIGAAYDGYPQYFKGDIYDVRIWKTSLEEELGMEDEELTLFIDTDDDDDGVEDEKDKCQLSLEDKIGGDLGVNRHIWRSGSNFTTLVPVKKGDKKEDASAFSMADTYGCSCNEILEKLRDAGLGEFGGHWKFGCSKSVIEDFIKDYEDGVIDGRYFIETIEVPGTSSTSTPTSVLKAGVDYSLNARGTYTFVNWANAGIADASCSLRIPGSFNSTGAIAWIPGSALVPGYQNYLELLIDGATANWGPCDEVDHTYTKEVVGNDQALFFSIMDNAYGDNKGSLFVDIYAVL